VTTPPTPHPDVDASLRAWRHAYLADLQGPRGWWSVVGLSFFDDRPTDLGSAHPELGLPGNLPERFARVVRHGRGARLERLGETPLWLDGAPWVERTADIADVSVLSLEPDGRGPTLVFLERGERFGVRVFDPQQGVARDPAQLAWFPGDASWRRWAAWTPAEEGETLPIVNMLGDVSEAPVAGRIHLDHQGERTTLLARPKPNGLMLHFRDATSGTITYGAGRFLHVDPPEAGQVWLDFNRAHHPPCAHTPHATCPMPPIGNRLPFAVTAGERTA
jgi:uncharacterized protein